MSVYTTGQFWDVQKLKRFKRALATANKNNQPTFIFDGSEFVPAYAKYLIEYLDARFKG